VSRSYAKVLTLKGCNSTGSIAMKIITIQLIQFSERAYDSKWKPQNYASDQPSTSNFNFKLRYTWCADRFRWSVWDQSPNYVPVRRLHKKLPWLSHGSLKGLLGPQSFCRSSPGFLFRVVSRQNCRLAGFHKNFIFIWPSYESPQNSASNSSKPSSYGN
jgi:hypothetical protein